MPVSSGRSGDSMQVDDRAPLDRHLVPHLFNAGMAFNEWTVWVAECDLGEQLQQLLGANEFQLLKSACLWKSPTRSRSKSSLLRSGNRLRVLSGTSLTHRNWTSSN